MVLELDSTIWDDYASDRVLEDDNYTLYFVNAVAVTSTQRLTHTLTP